MAGQLAFDAFVHTAQAQSHAADNGVHESRCHARRPASHLGQLLAPEFVGGCAHGGQYGGAARGRLDARRFSHHLTGANPGHFDVPSARARHDHGERAIGNHQHGVTWLAAFEDQRARLVLPNAHEAQQFGAVFLRQRFEHLDGPEHGVHRPLATIGRFKTVCSQAAGGWWSRPRLPPRLSAAIAGSGPVHDPRIMGSVDFRWAQQAVSRFSEGEGRFVHVSCNTSGRHEPC